MKYKPFSPRAAMAALAFLALALSHNSHAQSGSFRTSLQALEHSAQAAAYSVGASVQFAAGVSAVPFALSAQLGQVSGSISDSLMTVASSDFDSPLPVTDETITAGPPPDRALQQTEE